MDITYLAITILFAAMLVFFGVEKIRRDPRQLWVIHETVSVPLKYFPLLAASSLLNFKDEDLRRRRSALRRGDKVAMQLRHQARCFGRRFRRNLAERLVVIRI
jgi:hypothetical protein